MDVEGMLAIVMIFGGGTLVAISFSQIGRAIADRIRGEKLGSEQDPILYEQVERMRVEISELQERVEFTERLLANSRDRDALPGAH
jgi:hypothetical protein